MDFDTSCSTALWPNDERACNGENEQEVQEQRPVANACQSTGAVGCGACPKVGTKDQEHFCLKSSRASRESDEPNAKERAQRASPTTEARSAPATDTEAQHS